MDRPPFPTYYIANPVFRAAIQGGSWKELVWQVLALLGFTILFLIPLAAFAARFGKAGRGGVLSPAG